MATWNTSVNTEGRPLLEDEFAEPAYTMAALTRTRPVTAEDAETSHSKDANLARCLTWVDLLTYGLGSTVGAGIFVITGTVALSVAGPGVVLSFVFAGLASLISAFCYSEFSARIPLSGSAYTFSYATLGELAGWFIGWDLTLEYAISASAVAQAWNSTIVQLFGIMGLRHFPSWLAGKDINFFSLYPLSGFIVVAMTLVLLLGVKDSARLNMAMTIINISVIVFLVITGAFHINSENYAHAPLPNPNPTHAVMGFLPWGINGVIQGAGKVFFSFIGFDSVTTLAGEVAKPKRDLPIGIVGTLAIATALYVSASLVLVGMVPYSALDPDTPFSHAFTAVGLHWAANIIIVGSLTTMTAATLCSLLGQPRIYFQMAKDGLLWPAFAKLNSKKSPVVGTIITGIFATLFALFLDIDELSSMISVGTLLAFTLVCGGVVLLRYGDAPEPPTRMTLVLSLLVTFIACIGFGEALVYQDALGKHFWIVFGLAFGFFVVCVCLLFYIRPKNITVNKEVFGCPLVPVLPAIGMLVNTKAALIRVVVWAAIGMALYFGYGIKHSVLRLRKPKYYA